MSSNYQFNKFHAQDRMNAHLKAAQAHRQAQEAKGERGSSSVRSAVGYVYSWTGRVMRPSSSSFFTTMGTIHATILHGRSICALISRRR